MERMRDKQVTNPKYKNLSYLTPSQAFDLYEFFVKKEGRHRNSNRTVELFPGMPLDFFAKLINSCASDASCGRGRRLCWS